MIAVNAFKDPMKVNLEVWLRPMQKKRVSRPARIHYLAKTGDDSEEDEEEDIDFEETHECTSAPAGDEDDAWASNDDDDDEY